ncbi:cytochrome P450 [Nonomuraea sp. KC401]|uniref:cytochrome P450 n=1 Tax=unclassified Nonomuraea TaxID=2593643 RepID=UPI0010FE3787|nr:MULTISPECIES: cytochrome P450 [unclassified Nonomuraea]NBE92571.1 cytochrome P450 [Nonomuraea sp. K271]TLF79768.1 cytochrome P450 [Nonomuraea sp. KC401]
MIEFARHVGAPPTGSFIVKGWKDCRRSLSSSGMVSDPSRAGLASGASNNFLLMDGQVHQTIRRLIRGCFGSVRLDEISEHLEKVCDALVAAHLERPNADLMADLARPLALEGVMSLMKIPGPARQKLGMLTEEMLGLLEPELPGDTRRRTTNAALKATIFFEREGRAGRAVGLHATLEAAAQDGTIPTKLARSTPVVLLHGGYENPLNQLGCLIAWIVEDPERFGDAASTPDSLFEEIMRVFSPVRHVARWVADDCVVGNQPLKRGDPVWVALESANLDDTRFTNARDVDLSARRGHLGFGHGRHSCPGASLARLQGRVLIRALSRVPPELLRGFTVEWMEGVVARGPVKITRR